jgi:hypothetical protein
MNQSDSKSNDNSVARALGDWDVETIIAQIRRDLSGRVTLTMIQEVLNEVIPKYESARIQTFVPIFIHRDAVKQLKSMQATFSSPGMAMNVAATRNGSQTSSGPSQRIVNGVEQDKTVGTGSIRLKPAARGDLIETTA